MSYSLWNGSAWTELNTLDSIARANAGGAGNLLTYGYLEDVYDPVTLCAPEYPAEPVIDGTVARWTPVPLSDEDCAAAKRSQYTDDINGQVTQVTQTQTINDPHLEADVIRDLSAATAKRLELEQTDDADLDSFDSTLSVPGPQDDTVAYSRFTATVIELTPWAGAPDNIYGWRCELEVKAGSDGDGSEGRVLIVDDPSTDSGGVLPFTQDATNPALWVFESRDGGKWADPNAVVKCQLLWGAGSLPTSETLTCNGLYDRKADVVSYGVASGGGLGT